MKKCVLFILLLVAYVVSAQQQTSPLNVPFGPVPAELKNIDSLHMLLSQAKADSAKVDQLAALSRAYSNRNRDSTLWYAHRALDLAQKINYLQGQFKARTQMAIWLRREGNYPQAVQLLLANLQTAEQRKDTLGAILTNNLLAFTCLVMNDFARVMEYALNNKRLVQSGYFKTQSDEWRYSLDYMAWMADGFEGLNQLDSALYYYRRCHSIGLSIKDTGSLAYTMRGLGATLTKKGRYEEAFSCYRSAISYGQLAERKDVVSHAYLGLAKLFDQKGQMDSALYYSRLCLSWFQFVKFPAQELKAVLYINELFAKQNRFDSAYKYLAMATALKDSLFNQDKTRQAQNLQFNEILRLQQLAQQRKEAQQRYATQVKFYSLIAGAFVLMLIAFILYHNNQQKQKAKIRIERAYEELKTTQAQLIQREKMASLGELTAGIAHEIQNPLNFVNNFAEINDDLLDEMRESIDHGDTEEAKAIAVNVKENNTKISHHGWRADAIVKGMLQHSRAGTGEKQPTDINALCDEYLRLTYHGVRAKDKSFEAQLITDFDSSIGKINVAPQEIGQVLLNLFNNAFYTLQQKKQQLRDVYEPNVLLSTKKVNDKVEIHVRDNGTGIPQKTLDKIFQPFFTTKPAGEGTGLGLSLSYDIVTKGHGGELKVSTQEGEYAEFTIVLPT